MDNCQSEDEATGSPSAFPEFAEIFSFLNNFGPLLNLPPVSLNDLESFFSGAQGYDQQQSAAAQCLWTLLTHVTKRDSQAEWQRMAVKFGRKQGLFSESCVYRDLSLERRMKIFKLVCEGQFDSNGTFKEKLAKSSCDLQMQPIGYDRDGQRHWFFKDLFGELRLYAEKEYDEFPPEEGVWCLVCRCLEDLTSYIAKLESRTSSLFDLCAGSTQDLCDRSVPSADPDPAGVGPGDQEKAHGSGSRRKRKNKMASKTGLEECVPEVKVGGCIRCHQDSDYAQLLLCDVCNSECHMYCQYPVLWSVPQGTWVCPFCSERALVEHLKAEHKLLVETRALQELAVEKTKRNAVRLQRSGVCLQNIISEEGSAGRSRRARKEIDYAGLNDFYLPPLGPEDYVSSGRSEVMDAQYFPMRQSRRLKGTKPDVQSLQPDEEITSNREIISDRQITSNTSDGDDGHITLGGQVISDEQVTFGCVVLPGGSAGPLEEVQSYVGTPSLNDKDSVEQRSFEPTCLPLGSFPTHSLCDCYSTEEVGPSPDLQLKTAVQLLCPPGYTAFSTSSK